MTEQAVPQPQFDDTRTALTFALNYEGETKASTMTRILGTMSRAPQKRPGKAARTRFLKGLEGQTRELAEKLLEARFAPKAARSKRPGPAPLRGLDGAHMAGYILAHFSRLDEELQMVLQGVALRTHHPCSCRAPCCSGWRQNPTWTSVLRQTCEYLQSKADALREPGKKGVSTEPGMRLQIVMDHYRRRSSTLDELGRIGKVSTATAARHKEWITTHLDELETKAWIELAAIFDQAGITGAFT